MDKQDEKKEEVKQTEREVSGLDRRGHFKIEGERPVEKKEISPDEKQIREQLDREIDLMETDENLKQQANEKAKKISFLGDEEKMEHLLKIAREKGVVYAISVAKKMNDPYLLDILHDILAKEGFYQQFMK